MKKILQNKCNYAKITSVEILFGRVTVTCRKKNLSRIIDNIYPTAYNTADYANM